MKAKKELFTENVRDCADWAAVVKEFGRLPKPVWRQDPEGDLYRQGWMFRGHKRAEYRLEPSIERIYPYNDWPATEYKILREFQSKAQMLMDPRLIPPRDDRLAWLAILQHHGAPTRLLDFTYSPYKPASSTLRIRSVRFIQRATQQPGEYRGSLRLSGLCRDPADCPGVPQAFHPGSGSPGIPQNSRATCLGLANGHIERYSWSPYTVWDAGKG